MFVIWCGCVHTKCEACTVYNCAFILFIARTDDLAKLNKSDTKIPKNGIVSFRDGFGTTTCCFHIDSTIKRPRPYYETILRYYCLCYYRNIWPQSHTPSSNKAFADAKDSADSEVDESESTDADSAEAEIADGTEEDAPKSPEEIIEEVSLGI